MGIVRERDLWSTYLFSFLLLFVLQDNVFVNVVASIQYRALADKASDAFYRLSNTRTQIQAYVFDGMNLKILALAMINLTSLIPLAFYEAIAIDTPLPLIPVIRATVPKLNLDDAFEQKNEIAKAVEDELEKVTICQDIILLLSYIDDSMFLINT